MELHLRTISLVLALAALTVATSARAQSITAGTVEGTVRDPAGRVLGNVRVELRDRTTGFRRAQVTARDGRFGFWFLAPGTYDVLAEELGFRPAEVLEVPVAGGVATTVAVVLEQADPPVVGRTQIVYEAAALTAERAGPGWAMDALELRRLPEQSRDVAGLSRYVSWADETLTVEGLPAPYTSLTIDAIPFRFAGHSLLRGWDDAGAAVPLSSVETARLHPGRADVEWAQNVGAQLSVVGRRGSSRFTARGFGDWTGAPLARSKYFAPQHLSLHSGRAGFLLSGPVIRDTAHFVIGVEGRRLQRPFGSAWEPSAMDGDLIRLAVDSFGVDLAPWVAGRVVDDRTLAAFARFDWQASERNRLMLFAHGGRLERDDPLSGTPWIPALGSTLDGSDLALGFSLASALSRVFALELRAGFETSRRNYTGGGLALTTLSDGPIAFGTDGLLPGTFDATAFTTTEVLHASFGSHRMKLGAGASVVSLDQTYAYGRPGEFVFADTLGMALRRGEFVQSVGRAPVANFTALEIGAFLQNTWRAAPGFDVLMGMRVDWQRVPAARIPRNEAWAVTTGSANNEVRGSRVQLSPRGGFLWNVGSGNRWFVQAEGGLFHGTVPLEALAEAVAQGTGNDPRRGVGDLGRWPTPPDSVDAPVAGLGLTVLHPEVMAPRTARATLGLTRSLGGGTALHLTASYRHTDFLVRRRNLNLLPGTTGTDQYGRPLYGTLNQDRSLVYAEAGSNRRFAPFDLVNALDQDGYSDYFGFTARVDQRITKALRFSLGYTRSRTEDNWLAPRSGPDAQLSPFPDSLAGADWSVGVSDFDVPHRVVLGAEVQLKWLSVAGFYRYRTGYPFTPGFRDGVDANGDGSFRNDPAYVDDLLPGMSDLAVAWDCVRRQLGRFAERNSCRGPGLQTLDLRLVLGPVRFGAPVELVVDAINILDAEYAVPDRALLLVDAAGTLTTDPASGVVTVPLATNPNFGRSIRRYGSGRFLRLGLRVNYE
jgi:hypothetical protein